MTFFDNLTKIGKNIASAAVGMVDRLANKAEFEAVVAAVVLISTADGTVTADERKAATDAIAKHPQLASFAAKQTQQLFDSYLTLIGGDKESAQVMLLEKIKSVTDPAARTRIIHIAGTIAMADGSTDAAETAMILRIKAA